MKVRLRASSPNKLDLSASYELPFGTGKRYLTDGVAAAILGGWQLNAYFTAFSGSTMTMTANGASLNAPGNPQRADEVKAFDVLGGIGPGSPWFDPTSFAPVTAPRFGTSIANGYRGPGYGNLDASLFRTFHFGSVSTQIRIEALNVTNTRTLRESWHQCQCHRFRAGYLHRESWPRIRRTKRSTRRSRHVLDSVDSSCRIGQRRVARCGKTGEGVAQTMTPNPILDFGIDKTSVGYVGHDLQRPECILAEPDGTLWSADARGGVVRLQPDGSQEIIVQKASAHFSGADSEASRYLEGTLPNGLAFARNGDLLISNFGTDRLELMSRDGVSRVLADSIDGAPMGKVNFVLRDSRDRIWITVSTRLKNWMHALRTDLADGYLALYQDGAFRIVADGFHFTNEIRFDANEEFLYVVETTGGRITRLRIDDRNRVTDREVFGPSRLGPGAWPDGIAFDVLRQSLGHARLLGQAVRVNS